MYIMLNITLFEMVKETWKANVTQIPKLKNIHTI